MSAVIAEAGGKSDADQYLALLASLSSPAGLNALSFLAHPERVLGANDRLRVAVCGLQITSITVDVM